ncbi:uncharacterized protein LOC124531762 [Vanessa cardui]|uniref:uncharacterized protein LOC124531762 n=1 Tax=Vanessa cardui TaxID=171605 RepID=UPI001F144CC1|nr:uncharacterized protein LOC124531762 [Vanessa cardui]
MQCGVRQGGLTSPRLFNWYVDALIRELSGMRVGCHIGNVCVNNISYADDMALLAPSVSALRTLLGACERFAVSHGLLYNTKKSQFMVFKAGSKCPKVVPPITLCNAPLGRVYKFKYLGHIVTDSLKDDEDIERERRALSVRANMLITEFEMNEAPFDWLIMAKSIKGLDAISESLNATNVRFDQNIVVAVPDHRWRKIRNLGLCDQNFNYHKNKISRIHRSQKMDNKCQTTSGRYDKYAYNNCNQTKYEISYYRSTGRFTNIARYRTYNAYQRTDIEVTLPLWRSSILNYNYSRIFRVLKTEIFLTEGVKEFQNQMNLNSAIFNIYAIQFFKMRLNTTLFLAFLGKWNQEHSMRSVNAPYPVEARNLMGEMFIVGRCNSSNDGSTLSDEEASTTPDLLDNVLNFLTQRLNATSLSRYYGQLGYRSYEGAWTGLLGALMEHSVDIALEPVTAATSRQSDMDFIFPITRTMCNIYIRHQETSAVRDIFLAPFSPQLIACAVCVALVASITMMIISKTCLTARYMSFADAIIWSMGILCQQGSCWRPSNAAASVVLIVSLLFALVIYNAYAAFITSVLSVRVANVASLADVLQSPNIKIGYVRNGADQMYLMSTKDVQLNAFYIRGYSEAENLVSSTEEGLVRAASQDYAFFSGQRAARTTIRSLSQARGRCALRELPVLSTRAQVAFPLPSGSPYARPVLISLLQLRSGGILARLEAALVPSMPQCQPSSGFASARAADVKTALFVILTGYVIAIIIGIAEYSWENRKDIKRNFRRRWRHVFNSKDQFVNKNSSLQ